jgi:hypothetical protein
MCREEMKRMPIKKADLENIYHLTGEIRDIENQLLKISRQSNKVFVGDTYRDYSTNAAGSIKIIQGFGLSESDYKKQQGYYEKLRLKRISLIEKKMEMEDRIEKIPDAIIRRIIRLRFYDRFSWESVAIAVDGTKSGTAMRMRLDRYLEKI